MLYSLIQLNRKIKITLMKFKQHKISQKLLLQRRGKSAQVPSRDRFGL